VGSERSGRQEEASPGPSENVEAGLRRRVRSDGRAGRGIPLKGEDEPAAPRGECRRRAPTALGVQRTASGLEEAARAASGGRYEAGDPLSWHGDRRRREAAGRASDRTAAEATQNFGVRP